MASWLLAFIPWWVPYAAVLVAAVAVSGAVRWFTGSYKLTLSVLGAATVGVGLWVGYDVLADRLMAKGREQCVAAVETAKKDFDDKATAAKDAQAVADAARIKNLEAELQQAKDETDRRDRDRKPLEAGDPCSKCLVKRSWMRGN